MPKQHNLLEKFNETFLGVLEIGLSEDPVPISTNLMNAKAAPDASLTSLEFLPEVDDHESGEFRDPLPDELDTVVVQKPTIKLASLTGEVIEHKAPNGQYFTAGDLIKAVEETERQTRGHSNWFGGIDVHHVYFEGLVEEQSGVYRIRWGS